MGTLKDAPLVRTPALEPPFLLQVRKVGVGPVGVFEDDLCASFTETYNPITVFVQ